MSNKIIGGTILAVLITLVIAAPLLVFLGYSLANPQEKDAGSEQSGAQASLAAELSKGAVQNNASQAQQNSSARQAITDDVEDGVDDIPSVAQNVNKNTRHRSGGGGGSGSGSGGNDADDGSDDQDDDDDSTGPTTKTSLDLFSGLDKDGSLHAPPVIPNGG